MANPGSSGSQTTCTICTHAKAAADTFASSGCSHSFCTACFSNYIAAKLQGNVANVKCPAPNCQAALGDAVCEVMTMQLAERMNWKRCPNCKIYVERTEGCPHITCICGFEFCYLCGIQWGGIHGYHP